MTSRRTFLRSLMTAAAAIVAGPTVLAALPTPVPTCPLPPLRFHEAAYYLTTAPVRFDVLYGFGQLARPGTQCLVAGA